MKIMVSRDQMGPQLGKTILHKLTLEKICSKTSRPISIKLYSNYHCMKGIQVSLNKGPSPYQRGDNLKNANIV
jgi:hypothetical protein